MENVYLLYTYLFIAFVLSNIPLLSVFFKGKREIKIVLYKTGLFIGIVNTMIHESWHAILAILTGGRITGVSLFNNSSGEAKTTSKNRIARILVSYAGYTGSSLTAIGLFYLLHEGKLGWIILFFIVLALINWYFWIKNWYGFFWLTIFIAFMIYSLYRQWYIILAHTSIFLSCMVLIQSITTAFVIFKLSLFDRKNAGDASNLARTTYIPAFFWGTLFFLQSLAAGYFVFTHYIL